MCGWYFSVRVYVYVFVDENLCVDGISACVHVCISVCVCVFVYEDLCVYGISACVCMCTYLFIRIYVCMVFQRACVCVRIC